MATSTTGLASFFGTRAKYRTLTPQTVIVSLTGVAFAADIIAVYVTLGGAIQNYGGIALMLAALFGLFPLIAWLGMNTVVYVIARAVNANIRYGTLLRVTGWASIPMVGAGFSIAAGRYVALSSVDGCTTAFDCDPGSYQTVTEQVGALFAYSSSATGDPLFVGAFVVGLVLSVLTAALWVLATEQVSTLTRQGALVAAGIPAVAFIAAFVYLTVL